MVQLWWDTFIVMVQHDPLNTVFENVQKYLIWQNYERSEFIFLVSLERWTKQQKNDKVKYSSLRSLPFLDETYWIIFTLDTLTPNYASLFAQLFLPIPRMNSGGDCSISVQRPRSSIFW